MVNDFGQWKFGLTGTNEDEWCDLDYVSHWIHEQIENGYPIKTDIENLAWMIIGSYFGELEKEKIGYYAIKDNRSYPDNLMIHMEDVTAFVKDKGLSEFDYYV